MSEETTTIEITTDQRSRLQDAAMNIFGTKTVPYKETISVLLDGHPDVAGGIDEE